MDFRDTDGRSDMSAETATLMAEAMTGAASASVETSATGGVHPQLFAVEVDHARDALLTDFGKETLKDRYLLPGEI